MAEVSINARTETPSQGPSTSEKVALVTGGSLRVGRSIVLGLHQEGFNVIIHYNQSKVPACELKDQLNLKRPNSAFVLQACLSGPNVSSVCHDLIRQSYSLWNRLDLLVNNAASFLSTGISDITENSWNGSMDTNLKAPCFLMKEAAQYLSIVGGSIINMTDVYGEKAADHHFAHIISKAGLIKATECAAMSLGPSIRVNGISPGCVSWPTEEDGIFTDQKKEDWKIKTPLKTLGTPEDVSGLVNFLASDKSRYINGQIIRLDGGRALSF